MAINWAGIYLIFVAWAPTRAGASANLGNFTLQRSREIGFERENSWGSNFKIKETTPEYCHRGVS